MKTKTCISTRERHNASRLFTTAKVDCFCIVFCISNSMTTAWKHLGDAELNILHANTSQLNAYDNVCLCMSICTCMQILLLVAMWMHSSQQKPTSYSYMLSRQRRQCLCYAKRLLRYFVLVFVLLLVSVIAIIHIVWSYMYHCRVDVSSILPHNNHNLRHSQPTTTVKHP